MWLRELNLAGSSPTLRAARRDHLAAMRSYVQDYLREFDFYRHLPDLAAQEAYVLRLSLAQSDNELIELLFGARRSAPPGGSAAPSKAERH